MRGMTATHEAIGTALVCDLVDGDGSGVRCGEVPDAGLYAQGNFAN